jgi:hypothetical protein
MKRPLRHDALLLFFFVTCIVSCKPKQETHSYDLTSGASNGSKDGYKMNVSITGNFAKIQTTYTADMGSTQKVLFNFGDLNIREVFLKDSINMSVDSFINIKVHILKLPDDGKNYWVVPFDPHIKPWQARISAVGGSCCCGTGDGCFVSESGNCETRVCNACSTAAIKFKNGKPELTLVNKGFTLVQADIIEVNGEKFQ